jgi:hypothetical protein
MAEYNKLNKFLEDWNNSKLAGPVQHQRWMSTLRDDQRVLAGELQSKSLDQLVQEYNVPAYLDLYKLHPTYQYRLDNPDASMINMVMDGVSLETEIFGGLLGLQGVSLDWADKLLFEYEFLKQNGNSESYEEAYAWAAENADPITYEEFEAVRPLINFDNWRSVSFNTLADQHNNYFRAERDAEYASGDEDNDGVPNSDDAFPYDSNETKDSDGDGTGDNADAFPNDDSETEDSDGDGVGDNTDVFPNDGSESVDTDNDGTGDNADAFPNDDSETEDSDGDGVGDNTDVFPNDGSESVDTDNDGTGDNADAFPNDDSETEDSDGDGVGE